MFGADEARLKMGVLAYNILEIIRELYIWGEPVRRHYRAVLGWQY